MSNRKTVSKPGRPRRSTAAAAEIIGALTELAEALERGEPEAARFTTKTVEVTAPAHYDAAAVKATRERVGASQSVFARLLGVSTVLVQSWEQGKRKPSRIARRLLDTIRANPKGWARMVKPREGRVGREPVAGRIGFNPPPAKRVRQG
jgi:DNA-binding transcriptional regulator YiaG